MYLSQRKGGAEMLKFLKPLLPVLMLALVLAPSFAVAQVDINLDTPSVPIEGDEITSDDLEGFIEDIANFIIGLSLVIAVVFIVWGGILWMTAGGDDTKASKAKSTILNGIIGALIVLAVGVILNTLSGFVANVATFFS